MKRAVVREVEVDFGPGRSVVFRDGEVICRDAGFRRLVATVIEQASMPYSPHPAAGRAAAAVGFLGYGAIVKSRTEEIDVNDARVVD